MNIYNNTISTISVMIESESINDYRIDSIITVLNMNLDDEEYLKYLNLIMSVYLEMEKSSKIDTRILKYAKNLTLLFLLHPNHNIVSQNKFYSLVVYNYLNKTYKSKYMQQICNNYVTRILKDNPNLIISV